MDTNKELARELDKLAANTGAIRTRAEEARRAAGHSDDAPVGAATLLSELRRTNRVLESELVAA